MSGQHHNHHQGPGEWPVLDIGGEVGALIVYLARPPATGELHACPTSTPIDPVTGNPPAAFHTGVHPRDVHGAPTWVAIYPEVVAGTYHVLDNTGSPMAQVAVTGGQVEQIDLR